MRGYERDDIEDYDEYEEEGYEQEEEGEEEEEYEEEEERKPTAEELQYLELRARIKERIRKKMQRESGSTAVSKSHDIKKKVPSDNYGSFFGPSQPVIAQRVIQESKSFLENPHLASRVTNSHHEKKTSSSTGTGSKNGVHQPLPKVRNELKTKVQKLKDTRDYSFLLSDDAELPAPSKQSIPQTVTAPKSEARSAQVPQKSKQPSGSSVRGGREERKPIPMNGQMHSKSGLHRSVSTSKPASTTMDSRRQLSSNNGSGPGRPTGSKGLPPKMPLSTMEKKSFAPGAKSILPASHKPPAPKMQSSVPRQKVEQKRALPEPKKSVTMPNKPVASAKKPQINKPDKQLSSRPALQNNRPKKKPARPFSYVEDDEDSKALDMIRQMFNTKRYADRYDDNDDDDSMMEANFDDIMREERRSAKIAKKEDEEQLRLIEEEERRERERRLAKKRRLSQH